MLITFSSEQGEGESASCNIGKKAEEEDTGSSRWTFLVIPQSHNTFRSFDDNFDILSNEEIADLAARLGQLMFPWTINLGPREQAKLFSASLPAINNSNGSFLFVPTTIEDFKQMGR